MNDWGTWLASVAAPIAKKVAVALGFGYVTYAGLDTAVGGALDLAKSSFQGMPADIGMIVARFGFFDYMSITSGGIVSGLAWMYVKRLAITNGTP